MDEWQRSGSGNAAPVPSMTIRMDSPVPRFIMSDPCDKQKSHYDID
jgi:hypothetical protein